MTNTDPSDDVLVDRANGGDAAALELLYERYRQWVVDLAFRMTRDEHLAADVLQETFTWFVRCFPGFELRARMTTVLYPVVRNASITLAQRSRRARGVDARFESGMEIAGDEEESLHVLARAVGRLPVGQREVLLLRFVDGLSLGDISEALGVPLGTVKSRLHLALAALREDESTRNYFRDE